MESGSRGGQKIAVRLSVSRLRLNSPGKRNLIIIGKIGLMQVTSHFHSKLQLTTFSISYPICHPPVLHAPSSSDEDPPPLQLRLVHLRSGCICFDCRHSTHRALPRRARQSTLPSSIMSNDDDRIQWLNRRMLSQMTDQPSDLKMQMNKIELGR